MPNEEMTLEEAIKYGEVILVAPETAYYPKPQEAIRLLIEGGRIILRCRNDEDINLDDPLPGETKEKKEVENGD